MTINDAVHQKINEKKKDSQDSKSDRETDWIKFKLVITIIILEN